MIFQFYGVNLNAIIWTYGSNMQMIFWGFCEKLLPDWVYIFFRLPGSAFL